MIASFQRSNRPHLQLPEGPGALGQIGDPGEMFRSEVKPQFFGKGPTFESGVRC